LLPPAGIKRYCDNKYFYDDFRAARISAMSMVSNMTRLVALAGALFGATPIALAQDKGKPATPPDSYRVVMENERVRMIEININPRSKINVESQVGRERFLYMLSDGALILAPPGKAPYEFALHAGETAVFPAVSPTVENDTDSAVRALLVEMKEPVRSAAVAGKGKGRHFAKGKSRAKSVARASGKAKPRQAAKSRKPKAAAAAARTSAGPAPLNLRKAASRPAPKVSGKGRGGNG
jgi:hypothetical protein